MRPVQNSQDKAGRAPPQRGQIRLKEAFFTGLQTPLPGGEEGQPLAKPDFDFESWRKVCGKLYPAVFTGLLAGKQHYLPKKFAPQWQALTDVGRHCSTGCVLRTSCVHM